MEISKEQAGDILEMRVSGRLDAYWADHLSTAIEEAIREGADRIRLDMAEVSYMSSVGIRVLLKFYKQLQRIKGSFAVSRPSDAVKSVLELAGLEALLARGATVPGPPGAAPSARRVERAGAVFEAFESVPGAVLTCRVVGQPELLVNGRFAASQCRSIKFPDATFGVGLGAFGSAFADCQGRFGEFLAAGGAAAYLPADGSNVPDYLLSAGAFVPELQVLYALVCEGVFAYMTRFERQPDAPAIPLAELAAACLDIADADAVGMVMVAESAGLLGAALRRSPALNEASADLFDHPQVREWLSFTPERAYARSLTLIVGLAARAEQADLMPLLRPLTSATWPAGHFHAAAFSYRPLQKGQIDLKPTVATLFEGETLEGVLHLITDNREISGAGQSELVRGACWIGPIAKIIAERGCA